MELPFKIGDRLPDIRLGSMGGRSVTLSQYAGQKKLVYVWASWCGCREHLGALQEFHLKNPELPILTIACDAQGVDLPMKYLSRARATYEMWIDANCTLVRRWKLKQVGVLILLDENDVVLLAAERPEPAVLDQVGKLLSRPPAPNPPPVPKPDLKDTRVEFLVQLCTNYLTRKRVDDAVGFLKKALEIDPENRVLPKQIWALQHPEKFYDGPIDKEWQKQQPPVTPS
jgi:peroxiredoxin